MEEKVPNRLIKLPNRWKKKSRIDFKIPRIDGRKSPESIFKTPESMEEKFPNRLLKLPNRWKKNSRIDF